MVATGRIMSPPRSLVGSVPGGRNSQAAGWLVIDMNNLKHFDGPTFEADVLQSNVPVVVDFYADWCGPCRAMAPVIDQLATEYAGKVSVGKLDVDVNQDLAIRYGVMGIPTLGLFRGGKMVDRITGFPGSGAPIRAWINKNLPAETPAEAPAPGVLAPTISTK
jgi:thioredoxin 1